MGRSKDLKRPKKNTEQGYNLASPRNNSKSSSKRESPIPKYFEQLKPQSPIMKTLKSPRKNTNTTTKGKNFQQYYLWHIFVQVEMEWMIIVCWGRGLLWVWCWDANRRKCACCEPLAPLNASAHWNRRAAPTSAYQPSCHLASCQPCIATTASYQRAWRFPKSIP